MPAASQSFVRRKPADSISLMNTSLPARTCFKTNSELRPGDPIKFNHDQLAAGFECLSE